MQAVNPLWIHAEMRSGLQRPPPTAAVFAFLASSVGLCDVFSPLAHPFTVSLHLHFTHLTVTWSVSLGALTWTQVLDSWVVRRPAFNSLHFKVCMYTYTYY
jgi:hypothetical protein